MLQRRNERDNLPLVLFHSNSCGTVFSKNGVTGLAREAGKGGEKDTRCLEPWWLHGNRNHHYPADTLAGGGRTGGGSGKETL